MGSACSIAMEDTFKAITLWLASGTEAAAALIIGLGTDRGDGPGAGAVRARHGCDSGEPADRRKERRAPEARALAGRGAGVRARRRHPAHRRGPTWNEIGQLAAIAVLRTALNYFLQRRSTRRRRAGSSRSTATAAS